MFFAMGRSAFRGEVVAFRRGGTIATAFPVAIARERAPMLAIGPPFHRRVRKR
jgi:hypothetical protein